MEIITDYDTLSERSEEIDVRKDGIEAREIVVKLKNEIRERGLKGLSAPQIGYKKRVFVINFSDGHLNSYINPIITKVDGLEISREKCESIPGKEFIRVRHSKIEVTFQDPLGKVKTQKLMGLAAIVFQELLDHLDGLLLSDVGLEIDEMFDNATDDERQEVIDAYLDSLDLLHSSLEKEVQENEELKKLDDGAKFISAMQRGEVTVEFSNPNEK